MKMRYASLAILLAMTLLGCDFPGRKKPPTDEVLIKELNKNKNIYEDLIARLTTDFKGKQYISLWNINGKVQSAPHIDFSVHYYANFFRHIRLVTAITSEEVLQDGRRNTHLFLFRSGIAPAGGTSKGIAFLSTTSPAHIVPNLDEFIDRLILTKQIERREHYYRHVEGNWFLIYNHS